MRKRVADRDGEFGLLRHSGELRFEPNLELFEQRRGPGATHTRTVLWQPPADVGFNGVELADAA